jgi:hypothetical protein
MQPPLDPLFDDLTVEDLRRRPGVKWHVAPDVIPASVADMDFPVAPVIADAIEHRVRRGDRRHDHRKWSESAGYDALAPLPPITCTSIVDSGDMTKAGSCRHHFQRSRATSGSSPRP